MVTEVAMRHLFPLLPSVEQIKKQVPVYNTLPLPALSHPDLSDQHNQFKSPLTVSQAVCVCGGVCWYSQMLTNFKISVDQK